MLRRSTRTTTSTAAALAALLAAGLGLTGCTASRSSFAAQANDTCSRYTKRIDAKVPPARPQQGIGYAIGYFTELDLTVSTLRGLRLPAAEAADIRRRWLDPAQHDLVAFQPDLLRLRTASVAGDGPRVDALLTKLRRLTTVGVDAGYVDSLGVDECRTLFTST